ncbi:hypothetical protein NL676_032080 [Syzygium grande]|nr:hypothetical protein NL676_032080 [Syzygium grande]
MVARVPQHPCDDEELRCRVVVGGRGVESEYSQPKSDPPPRIRRSPDWSSGCDRSSPVRQAIGNQGGRDRGEVRSAMADRKELRVYNSMTQQKEVFRPAMEGKVGMYVCGVTSYDFSHLGHARAAVAFDVLYRYLLHLDYEVTYVRNFTDVDDKIIRRANETGENPLDLSNRFCQEYLIDMADLQCLLPTHQPRVSDHMEQIKDMITQIINNDCAYVVAGDVFFAVDKISNYGCLSGQKLENHRAGERVAVDSRKRNPADFALWKAAKPGEPSWESPWGLGRPGWHIECSAMSAHYLSFKFDIHGGGIDLIFPPS